MLQYNKIYQSLKKVTAEWHASIPQWEYYWYIFKFYEDGSFIYSRVTEKGFDNINSWFIKDNANLEKGQYEYDIQKSNLKIQFKGVSLYAGITYDSKLLLEGKLSWDMFSVID